MSSPYWNPQEPYQGGPPQSGGWSYGGPPPAQQPPPLMPPMPPVRYAGFGIRLVARTIDAVLAIIAALAFFIVLVIFTDIATGGNFDEDTEGALWGSLFFFGWGLLLFFYDWLYLITWGGTLGKLMVGIKVVDATNGGRLSQGQVIGRSLFFCLPQSLPCLGHLFSLGESMALFGDDRERALHDRVAGTIVVRTR